MNHIVNRESTAMRTFSSEADYISEELKSVCGHLTQRLSDANDNMRDPSGQQAISIIEKLVDDCLRAADKLELLSAQIKKSAELLEKSDTLL